MRDAYVRKRKGTGDFKASCEAGFSANLDEAMLNCGEVALVVERDGEAIKFVSYTLPRRGENFEEGELRNAFLAQGMGNNSAVDKTRPGNSTNHVASWISKGKIGCAPVVIKNGEQPKYFRIVILSAHKTRKKNQNHFAGLPPVAFQSICRRSQWGLSIFPFALELYEDILIPLIPYFFSNQATAARYTLALSVTIFRIHPQRHIISSNNHIPTDLAVSSLNGRPSAHEVIPHLP